MVNSKKLSKLKESDFFPILVLIFLSLIWGSSFILIKKGLLVYSPLQVGTLRIVFAFLVLSPIAIKHLKDIFREYWKQVLILGLISNLFPAILFATAQTEITSSLAGMLNSLTPIFTIIIGIMFFKSKTSFPLLVGLILGLFGSVILSFIGSGGGLGEFNFYALFVIIATILYGTAANLIKIYVNKIEPTTLVALTMFSVGPVSLFLLFTTDFKDRFLHHPDALISMIYILILGAIGTAFALVIFNKIIKRTSAVFASSVTYLVPIIAIGWGIIDSEILFPLHFLGISIIISGIFLINRYK